MTLTKEIAKKVLTTVDAGLCSGVGRPIPGQMCVEAAVCFALGQPHGDDPKCVGSAVRSFKISLNDASWSSNVARAKGMRRIAIAQLGSDQIDQKEFSKILCMKVIQRIVPSSLRAAASMDGNKAHAEKLLAAALGCETAKDFPAARDAARDARDAASDAASDAARAARAASDASDAARAARAASYAASDASDAARAASYASDASDAASYASDASDAARAASYASDAARAASDAARDQILTMCADCGTEALVELKSPGCEWLDLCL